jgi:hypothetical protein
MRTMTTAVFVLATTAIGVAADVWDKPFAEWSARDADKVLTDSPWAGKASITHARAGTNLGVVPDWDLIVSVRSALPYKQALLLKQLGAPDKVTPELATRLAAPDAQYVLAISGIPRAFYAQAAAIAKAAALKRSSKEPLRVRDASVLLFDKEGRQVTPEPPGRTGGDGPPARAGGFGGFGFSEDKSGTTATLFLGFSRDDAISADEGEVELSTVITAYNVNRKFKLKDMVVNGTLAF